MVEKCGYRDRVRMILEHLQLTGWERGGATYFLDPICARGWVCGTFVAPVCISVVCVRVVDANFEPVNFTELFAVPSTVLEKIPAPNRTCVPSGILIIVVLLHCCRCCCSCRENPIKRRRTRELGSTPYAATSTGGGGRFTPLIRRARRARRASDPAGVCVVVHDGVLLLGWGRGGWLC